MKMIVDGILCIALIAAPVAIILYSHLRIDKKFIKASSEDLTKATTEEFSARSMRPNSELTQGPISWHR